MTASPVSPIARALAERLFGAWVRIVSPATLKADAQAGLLGALLVLPQGIAFASLAGLPPQYGLYSALVPTVALAAAVKPLARKGSRSVPVEYCAWRAAW